MSQNRVIGKEGKIPWHISEDIKLFKEITLGHRVIMGRKTFDSLKRKPLPKRKNFVLSRNTIHYREPLPNFNNKPLHYQGQEFKGFIFYSDVAGLVLTLKDELQKVRKSHKKIEKNFIIGGQEIFQVFLPMIHKVYLSVVQKNFEGDTYLPAFEANFDLVENTLKEASIPFFSQIWKRKPPKS